MESLSLGNVLTENSHVKCEYGFCGCLSHFFAHPSPHKPKQSREERENRVEIVVFRRDNSGIQGESIGECCFLGR